MYSNYTPGLAVCSGGQLQTGPEGQARSTAESRRFDHLGVGPLEQMPPSSSSLAYEPLLDLPPGLAFICNHGRLSMVLNAEDQFGWEGTVNTGFSNHWPDAFRSRFPHQLRGQGA
jgi:hypothetical protein